MLSWIRYYTIYKVRDEIIIWSQRWSLGLNKYVYSKFAAHVITYLCWDES